MPTNTFEALTLAHSTYLPKTGGNDFLDLAEQTLKVPPTIAFHEEDADFEQLLASELEKAERKWWMKHIKELPKLWMCLIEVQSKPDELKAEFSPYYPYGIPLTSERKFGAIDLDTLDIQKCLGVPPANHDLGLNFLKVTPQGEVSYATATWEKPAWVNPVEGEETACRGETGLDLPFSEALNRLGYAEMRMGSKIQLSPSSSVIVPLATLDGVDRFLEFKYQPNGVHAPCV